MHPTFLIIFDMDKIKKLVCNLSKYGNCTKKYAASFLLNVFEKNEFFLLSDEKQEIIISNLLSYFDMIIISRDKVGVLFNKQNQNINKHEIFKHIEIKVFDLMQITNHLKVY